MTRIIAAAFIALVLALPSPAAAAVPEWACTLIRGAVATVGVRAAETEALRRGYTRAEIAAARRQCLRRQPRSASR